MVPNIRCVLINSTEAEYLLSKQVHAYWTLHLFNQETGEFNINPTIRTIQNDYGFDTFIDNVNSYPVHQFCLNGHVVFRSVSGYSFEYNVDVFNTIC